MSEQVSEIPPASPHPGSEAQSTESPPKKRLNWILFGLITAASILVGLWLQQFAINFVYTGAGHGQLYSFLIKVSHRTVPDWWEFAAFVTGVVCVYLEAVEHILNWPIGIANVLIYAWVFFVARLYADVTLQIFFLALAVQGWIVWAKGGVGKELPITRIDPIYWFAIAGIFLIGTAIYVPIITHFKGAAPLADSALTVASVIAQILFNFKKIETWFLWIAINAVYVPLYLYRDLVSTAVLYILFLVLSFSGLKNWSTTRKASKMAPAS